MFEINREVVEQAYEDATGLDANRGAGRIDNLISFMKEFGLSVEQVLIFNDTNKMRKDFDRGIRWYAGKTHGDTVCLGYTSGRANWAYKNAIFATSPSIQLDYE